MERDEWRVLHADARVARLAAAQRGAVSREQLLILGLSRGAVDRRVQAGRLHRLHRGVFAVGRSDLQPLGREIAALLACGPGATLSHFSAAHVWGFGRPRDGLVDVVVRTKGRDQAGIAAHRDALAPAEVRVRAHLRVTSPARTLLSLAGAVSQSELEQMVGSAIRQSLTTTEELQAASATRRRGARRLREVVEDGPAFTRSEAERRFLDLVRRSGLPRPDVNATIAGHEVDFAWREQRVVVEVDGVAFHSDRRTIEHDHERDADLDAAGFRVVRATWRQVTARPEKLLVRVARHL